MFMKAMQISSSLSLLSLVFCLTACETTVYRANIGPMFAVVSGVTALQDSAGNPLPPPPQNDIESELGLGDTQAAPYLRLQADDGDHRFRLHGFGLDASGTGTLGQDYGDIQAGSVVDTSMELFAITGNYAWRIVNLRQLRAGFGAQLGFYSLDVAARSNANREEVETSVVVPMPYAEIEYSYYDLVLGANGAIMAGDLGDANGRYVDLEGYARLQATRDFDITAGYRFMLLDSYGRASSRDFDADVQGIFVTVGLKF
jgi:hypothetical protein